MISDLWELETDGSDPSDKATLSAWGFSTGTLDYVNQSPDVLTLRLDGDADAADVASYGDDLTLYRDDVVVFRGRVTKTPRQFSGNREARTLRVENVWRRLLDTDYTQTWRAFNGTTMADAESSRYRLGRAADGSYETTATILAALRTFAVARGISFTWDLSALPTRYPGLLEGQNKTIGQVIREVLATHPEVVIRAAYSATGTVLRAMTRDTAGAVIFPVDGADAVTDLSVESLDERQVTGVVIKYEGTIERATVDATVEDLPNLTRDQVLILPEDRYPTDHTTGERTLVETIPAPTLSLVSAQPPVTQWQRQPITTEPLPAAGATNVAAQNWWLDKTSLDTLGITAADIALFATSDENHLAHTLTLKDPPAEERPSAINPNATPLYQPDTVEDLPRNLVEGSIADWMSVKAATVVAEATIAVRKSTADALTEAKKAQFLRLGPREGTISGYEAYLLDARVTVTGTNAVTKVYRKAVSVNYDNARTQAEADAQNAAAYTAAVEDTVIPGLAQALYEELSVLAYRGSFTLTENEALARRYLGTTLNLESATRTEWATMNGQIQSERIDIASGTTRVAFGPPEHLSIQDRRALHEVARRMQDRRAAGAQAPSSPDTGLVGPGGTDEDSDTDERSSLQQIGPSILPKQEFSWQSGGTTSTRARWDLVANEDSTYSLHAPKVISASGDVTSEITITSSDDYTLAAGKFLVAEITNFTTFAITIKLLDTWTGYPSPFQFEASSPYGKVASRIPLWRFYDTAADGRVAFGAVYGEKLIGDEPGQLVAALVRVPSQAVSRAMPYIV